MLEEYRSVGINEDLLAVSRRESRGVPVTGVWWLLAGEQKVPQEAQLQTRGISTWPMHTGFAKCPSTLLPTPCTGVLNYTERNQPVSHSDLSRTNLIKCR